MQYVSRTHHYIGNRRQENSGLGRIGVSGQISRNESTSLPTTMATAAAIDRVVHHSVILEFDVPSYRTNAAQQRGQAEEVDRQN